MARQLMVREGITVLEAVMEFITIAGLACLAWGVWETCHGR